MNKKSLKECQYRFKQVLLSKSLVNVLVSIILGNYISHLCLLLMCWFQLYWVVFTSHLCLLLMRWFQLYWETILVTYVSC